jgi:hypothetical protein
LERRYLKDELKVMATSINFNLCESLKQIKNKKPQKAGLFGT